MVEFRTDDGRAIPSRKEVGVLASGFDEGSVKVIGRAAEDTNWAPPEHKITMPDYSKVSHLQKYFGRRDFQPYPAWIYHKNGTGKIVENEIEAKAHGIVYREATPDERGRFGRDAVWDWRSDTDWRPYPHGAHLDERGKLKMDVRKDGDTKNFVPERVDQSELNRDLVTRLVRELFAGNVPEASKGFTSEEMEEFRRFQAFKAQQAAEPKEAPAGNALSAEPIDERSMWVAEAELVGLEVDRRWSLETLKRKVEEAR